MIQSVDNECYGKNLQASFKQSFIREEKNRGEKKKKDDVDIIETNGSIDDDMKFCSGKKSGEMLRWECYINEAFKVQSWVEIVGMMSGLKGDFLNNLPFIRSMFKNMLWFKEVRNALLPYPKRKPILLIISVRESPPVFSRRKAERKKPDAE